MPQSLCNFPTKTITQTTLQQEASTLFSPPSKQIMHKSSILAASVMEEIAEYTPVEIGTRGTVGSLVMQEIEYFSRIELNSHDRSQKNKPQITDTGSSCSTDSRATNLSTAASTKKKRVSSKLLPSMCSMVDVSDKGRPNGTSAFSYKSLKSDTKNMQV